MDDCRDWSTLPADILSLLLKRLNNTDTDRRRLRAVCTLWRSSLRPRPPLFPLEVLLPIQEIAISEIDLPESFKRFLPFVKDLGESKEFGFLRQSIFYLISLLPNQSGSSSGSSPSVWLTRVEETLCLRPDLNKWKLQNPLSCELNFKKLPELKAEVNSLEYSISEVARSYHLPRGRQSFFTVKTVMLLCTNSQDADRNFSLFTLRTRDLSHNQVSYLFTPGAEKWVKIPQASYNDTVNDIIAYQGKFYAVDFKGKLIAIDPITCEVNEVIKSQFEEENCDGLFCYLIESCGKLYLVQKVVYNNFFYNDRFEEYETDYDNGKPLELKVFGLAYSCSLDGDISHYWEPITSLGDHVFFVSDYVTFSVSARELGWDQGNCIFFAQEGFDKSKYSLETDEAIFYESKSEYCGLISKYCGLYTLEDGKITTADGLTSEHTNLFWPVPSCLSTRKSDNIRAILSYV